MGADTNATFSSQFKEESWYSLNIDKKLYCRFLGECDVEHCINTVNICLYCYYRAPIDIPKMIYKVKKEKIEKSVEEDNGKI